VSLHTIIRARLVSTQYTLRTHRESRLPAAGAAKRIAAPLFVLSLCLMLSSCTQHLPTPGMATRGNVNRGQQLIYSYNCGSCHTIPGVAEAKGTVGPPLQGVGQRTYIAGILNNTPENLSSWVKDPQRIEPGTAMPSLGITSEQAIDIAAYLYTLR
jgi:cytochrome c2